MRRIVIAGGTGFIGHAVAEDLRRDSEVVTTSRSGQGASVAWDGRSPSSIAEVLENADAVINLIGEPINQRWTAVAKIRIKQSRVDATRAFGKAIAELGKPPLVWLNASAAGYYGATGDREMDETSPPGHDFLAEVCKAWEDACIAPNLPLTRRVALRTGFVLGKEGGALPVLTKLTRWFLGGSVGSGRQYLPWISLRDHVRLLRFCLETDLAGPVNLTSPIPIQQGEFMWTLRKVLHRPWAPPAPALAVKAAGAILGFPPELALSSSRVFPRAAKEAGFAWHDTDLTATLASILG